MSINRHVKIIKYTRINLTKHVHWTLQNVNEDQTKQGVCHVHDWKIHYKIHVWIRRAKHRDANLKDEERGKGGCPDIKTRFKVTVTETVSIITSRTRGTRRMPGLGTEVLIYGAGGSTAHWGDHDRLLINGVRTKDHDVRHTSQHKRKSMSGDGWSKYKRQVITLLQDPIRDFLNRM